MADDRKRASKLRCAVYTRKSSEEGLEQEFNSLQAQREACEAFIASQRNEGWQALPASYDDGGWSGGTLDRPALQRLLADIGASKVDVVVVYKIDRLTRSLFDFAKIVEVFDAHSVSFVSVTQAFNTTTSMGRLTLNVLLSFAQFEREVTGERIRDKIAASKKKGMWMGGFVPLGYEAKDRKLVINKDEAESVRNIFRRYLELGSVYKLKVELDANGILSKRRVSASGNSRGGRAIAAGALYQMLQNPIYGGRIGHKGQIYQGEHQAIIEPDLWESVQQSLAAKRNHRRNGGSAREPSLLVGLIVDAEGKRLTPSHAVKRGKRYRYYVSHSLITDPGANSAVTAWRLPAAELERLVLNQVCDLLGDQNRIWALLSSTALSNRSALSALRQAGKLAQQAAATKAVAELEKSARLAKARDAVECRVAVWDRELGLSPKAPEAIGDITIQAEIRRHIASLKSGVERLAFIDAHATEVGAAVLTAPSFLSGLSPDEIRVVKQRIEARTNPEAAKAKSETLKALADAEQGFRNAARSLRELGGLKRDDNGGATA